MNKGRLILMGVALIAGGGAFFLVSSGGEEPAPVQKAVPKQKQIATVRVLVADATFERGAALSKDQTAWLKWPKDDVPEHVVTENDKDFYERVGKMRARTTIYEGEPIIKAKVVQQGDRGVMAALLTPGMRAVSMDLSPTEAAAGFVLPGDRVDVVTLPEGKGGAARTVYENVRVIAIDNTIRHEKSPLAIRGGSITFELPAEEANRFLALRSTSRLSLVLRSMFDPDAEETGPIDAGPRNEIIVMRYGQG